jgi:hypothetical protein
MKKLNLIVFLLAPLSICLAQTEQEQKATLEKLARDRSKALVTGDSVRMKEILDDSFFYINSEGVKRNKKEYIRNMTFPGDSKWISQEIEDMDIRLVGSDAAILSFVVLDKFRYEGHDYAVYNRSTFVYAKKGKTWKCMSGHTTEIGEKK